MSRLIGQEPRHECCVERYFLNLEAPELDLVIEAAVQSKSQTAYTSNSLKACDCALVHSVHALSGFLDDVLDPRKLC